MEKAIPENVVNNFEKLGYTYKGFSKLIIMTNKRDKNNAIHLYHCIESKIADNEIEAILTALGVGKHLNGYRYLQVISMGFLDNPSVLWKGTKGIYQIVDNMLDISPSRVERGIRHTIQYVEMHGNKDMLYDMCSIDPEIMQIRPSNISFLAGLYFELFKRKGFADFLAAL